METTLRPNLVLNPTRFKVWSKTVLAKPGLNTYLVDSEIQKYAFSPVLGALSLRVLLGTLV